MPERDISSIEYKNVVLMLKDLYVKCNFLMEFLKKVNIFLSHYKMKALFDLIKQTCIFTDGQKVRNVVVKNCLLKANYKKNQKGHF